MRFPSLLLAFLCPLTFALAEDGPDPKELAAMQQVVKVIGELKYQQGEVSLLNGKAKVALADDFRFLSATDAKRVLVEVWNNPPEAGGALGMIVPKDIDLLSNDSWVAVLQWSDDGYVKDDDYDSTDFGKMLTELKEQSAEASKERVKRGFGKMVLTDWAQKPHYDKTTHKLYWAKAYEVDGPEKQLNYDIRALGRSGCLEISIMSTMGQLKDIEKQAPAILEMVSFSEGNRYADYKSGDKVAGYGIAGLVAGGVLMKSGFFKVLLIGLAKFWKLIAVAVVAGGSFISKILGRKKADS
jgi:uncharacterized membrane-anchored protein